MIVHANRVGDVFGIYGVRSAGHDLPLAQVLKAAHVRIELMFSGARDRARQAAVPVIIARFIVRRAELEALPLFILFMSSCSTCTSSRAPTSTSSGPTRSRSISVSRPGRSPPPSVTAGAGWRRGFPARLPPFLLSPLGAAVVGAVAVGLPVRWWRVTGFRWCRLSRESGGRFMEVELPSEIDQSVALRWFLARQPPAERIAFHGSVRKLWHTTWEIGPRAGGVGPAGRRDSPRLFVLDARVTSEAELRDAAAAITSAPSGGCG